MPIHAVSPLGSPAPRARRVVRPLWRQLVGAVLRERRLDARLRLRDVAARAGISAQYLSEVERGRKDPSSEMLESICGALGMDLLDLVHAVGIRLMRVEVGTAGHATISVVAQPRTGVVGLSPSMVRAAA